MPARPAVPHTVARQALARTRVERERLIVRLRGFALLFNVVQAAIKPGDDATLTWVLAAVLAGSWLVTFRIMRRDPERNVVVVGWLGMFLDMLVCAMVLANNRHDPTDPVFLIVLFVALEAALRWGRAGGVGGGVLAGLMAGVWSWEVILRPGDGSFEHATLRFCTILIVGATTGGLVHRLDQERARLAELAYCDTLTGLANRPALQEELAAALGRGESVALVYLDLDGFKAVNDELGHTDGDAVLVAIADRLRGVVREHDLVARLGGDEFVVVVRDARSDDVDELVGRLAEAVSTPTLLRGRPVRVGASCGAVLAHPADTVDSLLRRADDAMYKVKREARR